jgi:hypothetical protein
MTSPIDSRKRSGAANLAGGGAPRRMKFDHEPENACSTVRSFV